MIKLIAFDLDGTLSQHRTPLGDENRRVLDALSKKYALLMVGAGACMRIHNQMGGYPIDIIGNYGLQYAAWQEEKGLTLVRDTVAPCDRESVRRRIEELRVRYGFLEYVGDSVEYHASGAVTFPIIGTKADIRDKLAFDPDKSKRRRIYSEVCEVFSEYNVFVGGSSSFDIVPKPYDKKYALREYTAERGIVPEEVLFVGDDYGLGGNDEPVFHSEFGFQKIDDYRTLPNLLSYLL